VVEGEPGAGGAVGVDAGNLAARRTVGDADDVAVLLGEDVEGRTGAFDVADDDDSVGVRVLEHRPVRHRLLGSVVDVAEEQPVPAGARRLVDAAQDLDVERVGDVAGDHTDQQAATAAQAAGEQVGSVPETPGRRQDAGAGLVADGYAALPVVEDPRHRRDRHAGLVGDVA
jgi:hypothetical protein